ncbi:hypothetical protein R3P38DRAFT_3267544 [Favolaschia claudopus]|uniref:Uncharacterized protein n=1 Tax=Favolaschia claudopus TaxID=2862362 RepID=A0AAW0BQ68_9AGAR
MDLCWVSLHLQGEVTKPHPRLLVRHHPRRRTPPHHLRQDRTPLNGWAVPGDADAIIKGGSWRIGGRGECMRRRWTLPQLAHDGGVRSRLDAIGVDALASKDEQCVGQADGRDLEEGRWCPSAAGPPACDAAAPSLGLDDGVNLDTPQLCTNERIIAILRGLCSRGNGDCCASFEDERWTRKVEGANGERRSLTAKVAPARDAGGPSRTPPSRRYSRLHLTHRRRPSARHSSASPRTRSGDKRVGGLSSRLLLVLPSTRIRRSVVCGFRRKELRSGGVGGEEEGYHIPDDRTSSIGSRRGCTFPYLALDGGVSPRLRTHASSQLTCSSRWGEKEIKRRADDDGAAVGAYICIPLVSSPLADDSLFSFFYSGSAAHDRVDLSQLARHGIGLNTLFCFFPRVRDPASFSWGNENRELRLLLLALPSAWTRCRVARVDKAAPWETRASSSVATWTRRSLICGLWCAEERWARG